MKSEAGAYPEVNRKWKSTCKVLLGGEVGELSDFEGWLSEFKRPSSARKSSISGKEAAFGLLPYYGGSKWLSFDDVHFEKKYGPLALNDCKDIDSLARAVSERIYYAGSVVLGNSGSVESSSYVIDSFFVYRSEQVFESKYVAYSTHCIYSDGAFGCQCYSGQFGVRSNNYLSNRTFEVHKADCSSDIYYSHGLSGCADCLFCFNLKNRRHCIGNRELPKEKYLHLKSSLLEQMRDELSRKKRLPSLISMAQGAPELSQVRRASAAAAKPAGAGQDEEPAEQAFSETCKIVLGRSRSPVSDYAKWLSAQGAVFQEGKSCASDNPVSIPDYAHFLSFPNDRLLTDAEADWAGENLCLDGPEAESFSFARAAGAIGKIAFFCPDWQVGTNKNNIDCPTSIDSANCLRCSINVNAKGCAYSYWPRNSEKIFGSYACGISSSFCIKCYFSKNLSRCFEVDAGRNCSDCYYCHNVENCRDCILCFNVKNLKCAVGNCELPKEEYLRIKALVLSELSAQLDLGGEVRQRVFSLLAPRKK